MIETNRKIIRNKVGLLNLAEQLGNVSRACKVMGFSRDTFYRYKSAFEQGGVEALLETSKRKPNMRNRIDEAIEEEILSLSFEYPAYGQVRIKNELAKKGMKISPCKSLLKRDYLDLHKAINKFLSRAPGLKDSFQNAGYHEDWPDRITGIKEFFDEFANFESCVKTVFASYDERNIHGKPLEPLLEGLAHNSHCYERKEFVKGFFTSNQEIFNHIASLPQICSMSTGCVAELKMKLPAVPNISQEELSQSLFGICSLEESKTASCCNDVESCEYLERRRRNICEQSVKRCESSDCETKLRYFKGKYLVHS